MGIGKKPKGKFEEKIARLMMHNLAEQFFLGGEIATEGKSEKEIFEQVIKKVKNLLRRKVEFTLTTDYKKSLLQKARKEFELKNFELSALFYATYFEHHINMIIVNACRKKKLNEYEVTQILKQNNLPAKSSWILKVLCGKNLLKKHAATINEISEIRNAFIHYKWLPEKEEKDKENKRKIEKAESVVRYLKTFESNVVFSKERTRIKKAILQRTKSKKA